jgi:putative membrane protein
MMKKARGWSILLVVIVGLLAIASFIDAPFPQFQWLHHIPTPVILFALAVIVSKTNIRAASVICILTFYVIHIIGARYIYSNVPYDDWSRCALNISLTDHFDFTRNHYDRFAHFAYGLLITLPIYQFHRHRINSSVRYSVYCAIMFIIASSAIYEIIEWLLAILVAPEYSDSYNGQQGDAWDAHKDIMLAVIGSLIAIISIYIVATYAHRKNVAEDVAHDG